MLDDTPLSIVDGLRALLASDDPEPSAVFWATAAKAALRLVAAGRLLPGVTEAGHDAWRVGPLQPHGRRVAAGPGRRDARR